MGFGMDRDGTEDLSASFRSLYKSIFGHSVGANEYINSETAVNTSGVPIPVTPSELNISNASLPLGASATALFNSSRNPHFTSLMDSFRDIAETNSWDKLNPSQIQGLMESFKAGEHDKFGLDADTYADLHSSFNQFLTQLNNRFLTGSSNNTPRLSEYNQQQGNPSRHSLSHAAHVRSGGVHHKYSSHHHRHAPHHQIDTMSPMLGGMHQPSPPSTNYMVNRTPSPHISPQTQMTNVPTNHTQMNPQHFGGYVNPSSQMTPPALSSLGRPSDPQIRSAATDLFDDEDDFDWSKLM